MVLIAGLTAALLACTPRYSPPAEVGMRPPLRDARSALHLPRSVNNFKWSGNPVLDVGAGGQWDAYSVWHSSTIFDIDDNKFKMWYAGRPDAKQSMIGYAESDDGLRFTRVSDRPIVTRTEPFEGDILEHPQATKAMGKYFLTYETVDPTSGRLIIVVATSADGRSGWTKTVGLRGDPRLLDETDVGGGVIMYEPLNSTYYMPFWGGKSYPDPYTNEWIGMAESSDGVTWTKKRVIYSSPFLRDVGWRRADFGTGPFMFTRIGDYYILATNGSDIQRSGKILSAYNSALISSTDLRTWQYVSPYPIITSSGPYEAFGSIHAHSLITINGKYYLYYSYWHKDDKRKIGVAIWETLPPYTTEVLFQKSLPAGEQVDATTIGMAGFSALAITVEGTSEEQASKGFKAHIYTSSDGTSWDTDPAAVIGPLFTPGKLTRATNRINVVPARYVKVRVTNEDRSRPVSDVKVVATLTP